MSYYLIGIGGTGAKCIEAVAHLAACGMLPKDKIYTMFVDPDEANGNLNRSREVIKRYIDFKNLLPQTDNLMATEIVTARNGDLGDVWSPVTDGNKKTMDDIFNYEMMIDEEDESERLLYELLYTKKERSADLSVGFRGHPSIGAAVIANTMNVESKDPWCSLYKSIANDLEGEHDTKIFIMGSIFGGTGASGFPTIAKLIKEHFRDKVGGERLKIGGALMLPYFTFISTPGIENSELMVHSEDFLINTQASLKYYYSQGFNEIYDILYLMSDDKMYSVDKFSIGSKEQSNKPHLIELYAGLAAIHFFNNNVDNGIYITGRSENKDDSISWDDFPNNKEFKQKFTQYVRFAYAFCCVYYREAKDDITKRPSWLLSKRNPWFKEFFPKKITSDENLKGKSLDQLKVTKNYCESFLRWVKDLHVTSDNRLSLINSYSIPEGKTNGDEIDLDLKKEGFIDLIHSESSNKAATLDNLRDKMCGAKCTNNNNNNIGDFLINIYNNCSFN